MPDRDLLRAADIAPRLGVTSNRIYQLIAQGKIPAIRDGRTILIPRAAWEEWLREQSERALSNVHAADGA